MRPEAYRALTNLTTVYLSQRYANMSDPAATATVRALRGALTVRGIRAGLGGYGGLFQPHYAQSSEFVQIAH